MATWCASYDAASPFGGWTTGSGSTTTGRNGLGAIPSGFLTKVFNNTGGWGVGLAIHSGDLGTEILRLQGKPNAQINPIILQVQQTGDGRLSLSAFSQNVFSLGASGPTQVIYSQFGWSFLEIESSWLVSTGACPADPANKTIVTYNITANLWLNNEEVIIGAAFSFVTGCVPNAQVTDYIDAGTLNSLATRFLHDDVYINDAGTRLGDSYVHSDDTTIEQVAATDLNLTAMCMEVALSADADLYETQMCAEIALLPNCDLNETQMCVEVAKARNEEFNVYEA